MKRRIVLAFDKFKGTFSSPEVCSWAAKGLIDRGILRDDIDECPLSDGGDGFLICIQTAIGAEKRWHPGASGADFVPMRVPYLVDGSGVAYVESAKVFGLADLPESKRNPLRTTTFGLGEMFQYLVDEGVRKVVVGMGGTATCDGGIGVLTSLGWRFLDRNGKAVLPVGGMLEEVVEIQPGPPIPLEVVAATDVWNPLYGPNGAAHVFAPQKGADPAAVVRLDRGLRHFARLMAAHRPFDASSRPGAGAAGGLGYALMQGLGAQIRSGAELALEASRFSERIADAEWCLTGEGRVDTQTLQGKLPNVVLESCKSAKVPCALLCGRLAIDPKRHGFSDSIQASDGERMADGPDIAVAASILWDRRSEPLGP